MVLFFSRRSLLFSGSGSIVLFVLLLLVPPGGFSMTHPELGPFPAVIAGQQRHVIVLPDKDRATEDSFKVELIPGRIMETDGVNLMRLGIYLEAKTLKGWGYTYYELTGKGLAMSSMMAVPEGQKKVEAFVAGQPLLIGYNSRLPVVIYTPVGYEIRYRVWSAGEEMLRAIAQ